jgi:hypothetical protein
MNSTTGVNEATREHKTICSYTRLTLDLKPYSCSFVPIVRMLNVKRCRMLLSTIFSLSHVEKYKEEVASDFSVVDELVLRSTWWYLLFLLPMAIAGPPPTPRLANVDNLNIHMIFSSHPAPCIRSFQPLHDPHNQH